MKGNNSPTRIDMAGQKSKSRAQTRPDLERGMNSTPPRKQKPSPTKTIPMTPDTPQRVVIDVNGNGNRGGGSFMRLKPMLSIGCMLGLAGGMAYFLLGWLEIPGLNSQIDNLKVEVDRLDSEVSRLNSEVTRLEEENDRYEDLNDDLNATVTELTIVNYNLTITAEELQRIADELNETVENSKQINEELESIAQFISSTAEDMGSTFESISNYLAEQIAANQELVEQSLENFYETKLTSWYCGYSLFFSDRAWVNNVNIAIPLTSIPEVIDYVDGAVLQELCIDENEFAQYMQNTYGGSFTSRNLEQAVFVVGQRAKDYYFPEIGESGITQPEWAAADFKCEKLSRPFVI